MDLAGADRCSRWPVPSRPVPATGGRVARHKDRADSERWRLEKAPVDNVVKDNPEAAATPLLPAAVSLLRGVPCGKGRLGERPRGLPAMSFGAAAVRLHHEGFMRKFARIVLAGAVLGLVGACSGSTVDIEPLGAQPASDSGDAGRVDLGDAADAERGDATVGDRDATAGTVPDAGPDALDAGDGSIEADGGRDAAREAAPADAAAPDAPVGGAPPQIVSFKANVSELRSDGQLVLTAIVLDPDGLSDLAGGQLLDPDTSAAYGAFTSTGAGGTFSIALGWASIGAVRPITTAVTGSPRSFRAEFFDAEGHRAVADLSVSLRCRDDALAACSNVCVDLKTNKANCGACGNEIRDERACLNGVPSCPAARPDWCVGQAGGACVDLQNDSAHCGSCDNALTDGAAFCRAGKPACRAGQGDYCASAKRCMLPNTNGNCGACGKSCPTVGRSADGGGGLATYCSPESLCDVAWEVTNGTCNAACKQLDPRLRCSSAFVGSKVAPCATFGAKLSCLCATDPE